MATKNQDAINLIDIFSEFKDFKRIDKQTLITVLEESFKSVIAKMYGPSADYTVIVNPDKGDLEIYRNRLIMEDGDVANPDTQISLSDALLLDDEAEIGEEVTDKVELASFGRRMILNLRQTLASKILELQKEVLYQKYKDMIGQIVTGELYQVWKKEMLLLDEEGNELYLPKQNQIPTDYYRKGEMVRAVVVQVDNKNQNPKIILSRTAPLFLQRMFEQEVPEVKEGLIAIKNIARIPGERAKVAVETFDDRIDPVGACVGVKGARIHGIVRELRNENIDVINYTSNVNLYIQRALAPAKINSMEIDEENKKAKVYLSPEEVSLAIGKGGYNVKLASMLTGYEIDVYRDLDEEYLDDIYLDEFNDEIDQWVIDAFKAIGLDTAKEVLGTSKEDLLRRTDLEEETVDDVLRILAAEFAND
ncbi:MAG: transcription termination/antitermination protein NusA [Paludibacteraceae bacterium]|nr:transcription termination/antitermination protein NusA [Paludibacteraceae bacterium]